MSKLLLKEIDSMYMKTMLVEIMMANGSGLKLDQQTRVKEWVFKKIIIIIFFLSFNIIHAFELENLKKEFPKNTFKKFVLVSGIRSKDYSDAIEIINI